MKRFEIVSIGELNPDLILSGIRAAGPVLGTEQEITGYRLTLGSSTAIATVLMQRLGLRTAMIARVGDDDYGRFCRQTLTRENVDIGGVIVDPEVATGVTISLAYPSDRLLLTHYGAMAAVTAADLDWDLIAAARHLHLGSFFIQRGLRGELHAVFRRARALGLTTSLDTGWDPDERWLSNDLRAVLAETTVFLPNETELAHITGTDDVEAGLAAAMALGVGEVLLKRGAAGSVYLGPEGRFEQPGFPIVPVDTTGAGDAFNAGYLTGRFEGLPVPERLRLGNACGAIIATAIGGTGGLVDRAEADAVIRRG
ncbi:MAG: carbohydrate kinase [Devosia sp.]|nr:carbohydrate kinase [Devosia sp.]